MFDFCILLRDDVMYILIWHWGESISDKDTTATYKNKNKFGVVKIEYINCNKTIISYQIK